MQKIISLFSILFFLLFISGCNDQVPTITEENLDNNSISLEKVNFPLAESYIVEFSGNVSDLKSNVESVGGVLDAAFPEIGYAQVSKLTFSSS